MLSSHPNSKVTAQEALHPEVALQRGNSGALMQVMFNPEGDLLVTATYTDTVVWDVLTGLELRRFPGPYPNLSPSGKRILTTNSDRPLKSQIYDIRTGKLLSSIAGGSACFLSDDEVLAAAGSGADINVYDAVTGELKRQFTKMSSDHIYGMFRTPSGDTIGISHGEYTGPTFLFKPDGTKIGQIPVRVMSSEYALHPKKDVLVASHGLTRWNKGSIDIYDLKTQAMLGNIPTGWVTSMSFNGDGSQLVSGNMEQVQSVVWDFEKRTAIRQFPNQRNIAFSRDGHYIAMGNDGRSNDDNAVKIVEADTGVLLKTLEGRIPVVTAIAARGRLLATGDDAGVVRVWDLAQGRVISGGRGHFRNSSISTIAQVLTLSFSGDGSRLLSTGEDGRAVVWDTRSGQQLLDVYLETRDEYLRAAAKGMLSTDGTTILSLGSTQAAADAARSGFRVERYSASAGAAVVNLESGEPIDGGKFKINKVPGGVQLLNPRDDNVVATLVGVGLQDGVVLLPEGYYAASKGALKSVAFRAGMRAFPFEQFDLRMNRPDLVAERLGYVPASVLAALKAIQQKRVRRTNQELKTPAANATLPELELVSRPSYLTTDPVLTLKLHAVGSAPLRRLYVYVDDVPFGGSVGRALDKKREWRGEVAIPLLAGENKLQFAVEDESGLQSLRETVRVNYKPASVRKPDLYVLSIGVSKYKDSSRNLEFAAKDASDLAEAFKQKGGSFGKIEVKTLVDAQATQASIKATREWLNASQVEDEVVLFVAGHGLVDEKLDYYFATTDVDFAQPAKGGVRYEALEGLLDGIAARKKLLLMDTCFSGEIDKEDAVASAVNTTAKGNVKTRAIAARGVTKKSGLKFEALTQMLGDSFADLRRGSGAVVISSAGGAEFALESDQWRNGVFTYSMIRGLRGDADGNKDGKVHVSELRDFVVREVKDLTQGRQTPTARRENLENDFIVY